MLKRVLPLVAVLFVACGDSGEQFENFCVGVDCGSNGRCAVGAEGAICICDSGFTLQDGACKEAQADDPCKDVTCAGHGSCIASAAGKALCICELGYRADGLTCVAVDDGREEPDSACKDVTCSDHGTCIVSGSGAALCICDYGYNPDGLTCVVVDDGGEEPESPCKDVTCDEHGTCVISGSGDAFCVCKDGFRREGLTCVEIDDVEEPPSPCKDVDCGNGTCVVSGSGTAFCICYEGYRLEEGTCVAIEIEDPCEEVDCGEGGTCVITGSGAPLCICDEGFRLQGDTCVAIQIEDPCADVNCGEGGTCVITGSGAPLCICNEGFRLQGDTCVVIEIEDPCAEVTCGDNGHCVVSGSGEAFCICNDGFSADGLTCVPIENPCSGVTCSDNGTCVVTGSGDALCICNDGYHNFDNHCLAEDPCLGVGCSGHGTCAINDDASAVCVCEEGYRNFGNYCLQVDDCVTGANCDEGWCLIPACTFEMGSPYDEKCRFDREGPVHSVTITRPFYMKQTEVTQKEWSTLIGNNPSGFRDCGDDCPVENVSWYDAVYYANELSAAENLESCYRLDGCTGAVGVDLNNCNVFFKGLDCKGYRLPTEAEWEYATRAGTKTAYWIGSNVTDGGQAVCSWNDDNAGILLPDAAWYAYNSDWTTHPVGQKAANPFGLYDVHGNVFEWVYDWFDPGYYQTCAEGCEDPRGPDEGSVRVNRGGSWGNGAGSVRAADRDGGSPGRRDGYLGFRLARSAP